MKKVKFNAELTAPNNSPDEFTFRRGDKLFECKWENDELVYTQGCKK